MIANNFNYNEIVLYLGHRTPKKVIYLHYINKHTGWHYFKDMATGKIGYTKKHYLKKILN